MSAKKDATEFVFEGERFLRANGIHYITEGDRHCRDGWLQLRCCCGRSRKYHLGLNMEDGGFVCYSCGSKKRLEVVSELLNLPEEGARRALRGFIRPIGTNLRPAPKIQRAVQIRSKAKLPSSSSALKAKHQRYLRSRRFDPDELERVWGLLGTNRNSNGVPNRILAPIMHNKRMVSYHARAIMKSQSPPWLSCPPELEAYPHRKTLYGLDKVPEGSENVLAVEGLGDVWRFGPGTVATYGTRWNRAQVNQLRKFKNRFIMYDPEPAAQEKAEKLAWALSIYPGHTEILELENGKDPGAQKQSVADHWRRELKL